MDKKIALFIMLIFFMVLIVIFLLSLFMKKEPNIGDPIPTPTTIVVSVAPSLNRLTILSILPEQNVSQNYLPFQKITINFSTKVLPSTLLIQTSPETEVDILPGTQENELLIIPITTWTIGTTNITILQATSVTGANLNSPFSYSLTTALPTLSPEELNNIYP